MCNLQVPFNEKKKKENPLPFHRPSFLSCSILRTKDFQVEKTLSKHSGGVTCLSIHPSGKMALSVGKDHKLITWNLIKGRSAYVTNVKEVSDLVRWSPDGERYLVAFRGRVDVYRTDTAKVENAIRLDGTSGNGRANEIAFLDRDTAVVAGDFPEVEIHCLEGKRLLHKFAAHEKRVRCGFFLIFILYTIFCSSTTVQSQHNN